MMVDRRQGRHLRPEPDLVEAVRIVRSTPLLGSEEQTPDGADPRDRGWFCGPEECARVLAGLTGGKRRSGYAFGNPWPWLEVDGAAIGPALPAAVTVRESAAPDGVYRREGARLLREAGGREQVLLSDSFACADQRFDLLWFTDNERFVVRDGDLEVEDLFSRTVVPAHRETIERWLVRRGHHRPEIIESLPVIKESATPKTVQVARQAAVTAPSWKDPVAVFRSGIGFDDVRLRADRLKARSPDRQPVEFSLSSGAEGWRAQRTAGAFPFETLTVEREGNDIVLSAIVALAIDPLARSTRERLAFDLRSFLVSLES